MKHILASVMIFLGGANLTATGQSLSDGVNAFNAGNYIIAYKNLRPLAEQGDEYAQLNLGRLYESGNGVLQDYEEAVKWYRLAAEQGNTTAQYNLGWMHENGEGVLQDYTEAAKWYRLAAEQGNAEAKFNLAVMYEDGNGVLQDYVKAHMWANIAAANGYDALLRDSIAENMTSAQIAEAQRLARLCMASDYQDCD